MLSVLDGLSLLTAILTYCRYNQKLLAFSAIFLASALLLTHIMGSAGFVLANCVNMAVRIWHRLVPYLCCADVAYSEYKCTMFGQLPFYQGFL